ncbi:hypothetical protein JCM8547_006730 [Rhodosporidiobolus lusitaniae]
MAVGTYVHRRVAAEQDEDDHLTSFMTDAELFTTCLILLCFFFPPLPIFLERGCGLDLLLNFLLTCLGFLPGLLHALWVIVRYEEHIVYTPSRYASPPPAHLTLNAVFRAGSDEDRAERKARRRRDHPGEADNSGSSGDESGEEEKKARLERAPSYRSTRTGPPAYVADGLEDEELDRVETQLSEKQRGKQTAREEDPGDWV